MIGFVVRQYNSFEAMMEDMRKAQAAADQQITPWQLKVEEGDCFIRLEPELTIFGEVLEQDPEDLALHPSYRWTKCYSSWCPEGEKGDTHVSRFDMLISRRLFEFLKSVGWPG